MPWWWPVHWTVLLGPEGWLVRLVQRFAGARSWDEAWRLLARHPELMGDEAQTVLVELAGAARRSGLPETADDYDYYRAVLRRCREVGPDRAYAELTTDEEDEDLLALADEALAAIGRYRTAGRPEDLAAAVAGFEQTLRQPVAAPARAVTLGNLGLALLARASLDNAPQDVERALSALEEAMAITPPHEPEHQTCRVNLGVGLVARYETAGDRSSLDRAIEVLRGVRAEELPDGARPEFWTGLGAALVDRLTSQGSTGDLEEAIAALHRAAELAEPDGPAHARALGNLGVARSYRYLRGGDAGDLAAAIGALTESVRRTPEGSPERPARLAHLAGLLVDEYDRSGGAGDLDRAVRTFTEAADSTPEGSAERAARDGDLGTVLLARYEATGDLRNLDAAATAHRRAVDATYPDDPDLPLRLDQLATTLRVRAHRRGDAGEAAEAVRLHERAVAASGDAVSLDRAALLANSGGSLRLSADLSGDRHDLERALAAYRAALAMVPRRSRWRGAVLTDLGNGLLDHAVLTGDDAELDEAVHVLTEATLGTGTCEPALAGRILNLANALRTRHERHGSPADPAVTGAYRRGCELATTSSPEVELAAGRAWGMWAMRRTAPDEAVQAFDHVFGAAERLVRAQPVRRDAAPWLSAISEVPPAAASALTALGRNAEAVLRLEQGRARFLSEVLARDHADLDRLRLARPDLAERHRSTARRIGRLESAHHAAPGSGRPYL